MDVGRCTAFGILAPSYRGLIDRGRPKQRRNTRRR